MKRVMTTLVAVLLISACSRSTGKYPEEKLEDLGLTLRFNSPAEVSGFLSPGIDIAEAVEAVDPSSMRSLTFICGSEDSVLAAPLLQNMIIPVTLSCEGFTGSVSVGYTQDGLTWLPGYSWDIEGSAAAVTATVTISNITERQWNITGLTLLDRIGNPVCGYQDSLTIPEGELCLGWWTSQGTALPITLLYGRPVPGQWNTLQPMVMDEIGSLTGVVDSLPEWPFRTGDTLWIPAEEGISLLEDLTQVPDGYDASLIIENTTPDPVTVQISHPDRLPRGAWFIESSSFEELLTIDPRSAATVEYSITYR